MKTDKNKNRKNGVELVIAGVLLVGEGLLAAYSNPKEIRDPKKEGMLQDP